MAPHSVILRPIDKRRIAQASEWMGEVDADSDHWYIDSILAQCFLPYRNPKVGEWVRTNGDYGIAVQAGIAPDPSAPGGVVNLGLPYGAKPRLINCYVQTYAIRYRTPVVPVESSMSAFMRALGFKVTGGKRGSIAAFRDQIQRLAGSRWTIWGPRPDGQGIRRIHADHYKRMDLWVPDGTDAKTSWPTEIEFTTEFYEHLMAHAVPYDFTAMAMLRENARAQDIYLWMSQRLHRIPKNKPLILDPLNLLAHFGGGVPVSNIRFFMRHFDAALRAALLAYPAAKVTRLDNGAHEFRHSPPPIKYAAGRRVSGSRSVDSSP